MPKKLRIADPIHGSIELTEVEAKIIQTAVFQRLRNVKQLGLAHLIYPAADYSRFSHSLGACQLAGLITDHLSNNGYLHLEPEEKQLYRAAALLHDVGHYPYSHATEDAIKHYYEPEFVEWKTHESVGKLIVDHDPKLSVVLRDAGIDTTALANLASGKMRETQKLANLVSADLDVDRMDYLQRTARHTALPYGTFDVRYLISQMRTDDRNRLALTYSALGTVEHLLMGRYYDYLHVSFHKTVQGLEWLLKDTIEELIRRGILSLNAAALEEMIRGSRRRHWADFDDSSLFELIKQVADSTKAHCQKDDAARRKAEAVFHRAPPTMIAEYGWFTVRDNKDKFSQIKDAVEKKSRQWAEDFEIDETYWHVWSPRKIRLTKNAPTMPKVDRPAPGTESPAEEEDLKQIQAANEEDAPRIMEPGQPTSHAIFDCKSSIMQSLSGYEHFMLRVYVLLSEEQKAAGMAGKIRQQVLQDFPDYQWSYKFSGDEPAGAVGTGVYPITKETEPVRQALVAETTGASGGSIENADPDDRGV